jgi:DNA invertase Pin-like site-specific DNA recombinase
MRGYPTDGQSVDAQVRQLKAAGCKMVYREVASGAKTDRAQLRRLLGQLDDGDVLTVTRLDRLARSTRDLLVVVAYKMKTDQLLLEEAHPVVPGSSI